VASPALRARATTEEEFLEAVFQLFLVLQSFHPPHLDLGLVGLQLEMWGLVSSIPAYWIYVAHARPSHQRHTCTRWCQPAMAQFSTVGKLRSNYAHARLDGSECFPISMTTFKSSTDECFLRDRDRVTSESSYKID
jgi:hypothetical protein